MYICNHCGNVFDEPHISYTAGGDYGEAWAVCPHCGSDDMSEAFQCFVCGDYITDSKVEGICDACLERSITPESFDRYLKAAGLEEEFYLSYCFDNEQLLDLAKEAYKQQGDKEQLARDYIEQNKGDFVAYLEGWSKND